VPATQSGVCRRIDSVVRRLAIMPAAGIVLVLAIASGQGVAAS
jgi:hypothetical protein